MGTWGTAIFSDDTASDVRSQYREYLEDGLSNEEATRRLIESFEDEPVFWLALASCQHQLGRLMPFVQRRALAVIDSGEDLEMWDENPRDREKRRLVLEKLKEKLDSPQGPAKKVSPKYAEFNQWPVGQIVTYRLRSGNLCLFKVVGHSEYRKTRWPLVHILDWRGTELPGVRIIAKLPALAWGVHQNQKFALIMRGKKDFPAARATVTDIVIEPSLLTQLTNRIGRLVRSREEQENDSLGFVGLQWKEMDERLLEAVNLE